MKSHTALSAFALLTGMLATLGLVQSHAAAVPPLRIGALYPLTGPQGSGGREEYDGLQTAAALVNASGGVDGRRITFVPVNVPSADDAPAAVDHLKALGVPIVTGSYGSTISLPASREAQHDGLIFWESGAVATMITEAGYPNVFRTVTTGNSLGRAAADYVARDIAPRLRLTPHQMRAAVIYATDVYGTSVGSAMIAEARSDGFKLAGILPYDPYQVDMARIVTRLKALHPDAVLVVSYVKEAIQLRLQTLKQGFHPAVMIGTSSAFCMPAFGDPLGSKAMGLFASDKPDASFNPRALLPGTRALRARAVAAYRERFHAAMSAPALAGFVAGWVLFHDVLPAARSLSAADIRKAALAVNLPYGSEINGAGVRFAGPDAPDEGQNLRAISVIWQWQSPGHAAIVYPASYANASPIQVPLPGWRRP